MRRGVHGLQTLLADLTSQDEARAEASVPELVALGEDAIPALLGLSHSTDSDKRWWAVRVLGESPHTPTENLLPFLEDSAAEVRQAAALALSIRADESMLPDLIRALSDKDSIVGSLVINALVKVGAPAVPALLEVLNDAPQATRVLALRALAEIKDHRAIPVMMKVMQEDSALLQHWAQEGLERLGLDMVYIKPN